jgi:hypothetical protein
MLRLRVALHAPPLYVRSLHRKPFARDNRASNQLKASAADPGRPVSKKLLACRTTKDFIKYAKSRGCEVVINSNHVKVMLNGVTTGFQSPGKKQELQNSACKQKIEAFKAMGIAWEKPKAKE